MTAQNEQPKGQAARVAELHRKADDAYRNGTEAREGLDRAEALRRESWGH